MTKKKKNYQITIGYRAVVQVDVKADSEEEAKKKAIDYFEGYRHFGNKAHIADDNYAAHGAVDYTETWDMVQS